MIQKVHLKICDLNYRSLFFFDKFSFLSGYPELSDLVQIGPDPPTLRFPQYPHLLAHEH
jgi:hypothetical protein